VNIKTVSWIHFVLLLITGGFIIGTTLYNQNRTHDIKSIWLGLEKSSTERGSALSAIRGHLGYGGLIHNFKNYVLRGEKHLYPLVVSDIVRVNASLERYRSLGLNSIEQQAISDIKSVVNNYARLLPVVEKMHFQNREPHEIDRAVRVDDKPAFEGLAVLKNQDIHSISTIDDENLVTKIILMNRLKKAIGYGGMIHNFKNFVLRGDQEYRQNADKNLSETINIIAGYRSFALTNSENSAINTIEDTLRQYRNKLDTTNSMIQKKLPPNQIDQAVKIDDTPALNSMAVLTSEISKQTSQQKVFLHNTLDSIIFSEKLIVMVIAMIIIVLIISTLWFIQHHITRPINSLSNTMIRLAKDDTDITITDKALLNEIQQMAETVKVFRENVIRRDEAEHEFMELNERLEAIVQEKTHAIKINEQKLNAILDKATDAIITIDRHGIIQSANAATSAVFSYLPEELIGKSINILIPGEHNNTHQTYIDNYMITGKSKVIGYNRELEAIKKDGTVFPIELSVSEISNDNEILFTGFARDLTARKQNESHFRQVQKMNALGKLIGGIAHDYNNMLGVILGYSELISNNGQNKAKVNEYTQQIQKAAKRGAHLTNKLLSFSKQKGSLKENCDINQLILKNQSLLEKTLTPRIELVSEFDKNLSSVLIDPNDFQDALLNLCINSKHAIETKGKLLITTRTIKLSQRNALRYKIKSGEFIEVSVKDTGTGINKHDIEHIFDPFFTTKGDDGTGLGLSQVYGFVQRSNGFINVNSTPGHGCEINLCFPVSDSKPLISTKITDKSPNLRGTEHILVVDDEVAITQLTSEILTTAGYSVITANSGKQTLEILNEHSFDLLISDILMPEMDGFELVNQLHELYPDMKIQLFSGYNDNLNSHLVDASLVENIIHKPFEIQQLLSQIRKLLNESNVHLV